MVEIIKLKTGVNDDNFVRLLAAYYMCIAASNMHTKVKTPANGNIPVNMYLFNLAPSGYSKGFSRYILKTILFGSFFKFHKNRVLPKITEKTLVKIASNSQDDDLETIVGNFHSLGNYVYEFGTGTLAALRQLHYKIMMCGTGALNLIIDEIGDNLMDNNDLLGAYFELWDIGFLGEKILKVSQEQKRMPTLNRMVPTNLLAFGSPVSLFDGSKIEQRFYKYISTGYARRPFFGYSNTHEVDTSDTAENRWKKAMILNTSNKGKKLRKYLGTLATVKNHNKLLIIDRKSGILLYDYRIYCEKRSNMLPTRQSELKSYLLDSHMKVMKLAGAYAFIDKSSKVTTEHIKAAIKLNEDSYHVFKTKIMVRTPNYVKFLTFLVEAKIELTEADISASLPFYPTTKSGKEEIVSMAASYGYGRGITLKINMVNGIPLYSATQLTKSKEWLLSYSASDITKGFKNVTYTDKSLMKFLKHEGVHFVNHHLDDGYRDEKHIKKGFNLLIFDIDKDVQMGTVKILFDKYKYVLYETKRSTKKHPRMRLILFSNYVLELNKKEYKAMMKKLFVNAIPFKVDTQTGQRSRKWLTNSKNVIFNKGDNFNILPYIPQTNEYKKREIRAKKIGNVPALERWLLNNMHKDTNRNNYLIRYGFVLMEQGYGFKNIKSKVLNLNKMLGDDALPVSEIKDTVLVTVKKGVKS